MVASSSLNGYDLIYSVKLEAIAKQFQLLYILGVLPTSWQEGLSDKSASIKASLGCPQLSASINATGVPQLELSIPIADGTFSYTSAHTLKTIDLPTSKLVFSSQLRLGDLGKGAKISPKAEQQLKKLADSALSINQLFLDLEDANLIDSVKLVLSNGQSLDPPAKQPLKDFFSQFIAQLKASGNPFILGYAAVAKTPSKPLATWVPTHLDFSIYVDPKSSDKTAINYLMMTEGRKPPTTPLPAKDWIGEGEVEGCLAISAHLLLPKLIVQLAVALHRPPSVFVGRRAEVPNNIGGDTTCVIEGLAHEIEIVTYSTFVKTVKDGLGTKIGKVTGELESVSKIIFSINAANNHIAVSCTKPTTRVVKKTVHRNFWGVLESILAKLADDILQALKIDVLRGFFETLVRKDWSKPIADEYNAQIAAMKGNFILPVGSVLLFKDVRLSAECDMVVTTTIKD